MQAEAYGIDLSQSAFDIAIEWAKKENISGPEKRIVQGDISNMPFENNFFDFIISHGVLNSMSDENCKNAIIDSHRVLKDGGYFY